VARWRFSNQSVTATICPAKIVGSASPTTPRQEVKSYADGEFDDVGRKAAADAGQRPSDDTSQHHLLRPEAVHQNARYGIHDGVTDQEYVDDPRVLEVFDAEMGQDFGFEDRQQLAVEVVADDCDENRRHNIPTTLVRVLK